MKILGFNRVELIVREDEIDAAVKKFNELLGTHLPEPFVVPGQTVKSATDFDGFVEFVSGVNGEGPFAARVAEKGAGQIGPLVWEVDDIDSAREWAHENGLAIAYEYESEEGIRQIIFDRDEWFGFSITFMQRPRR
jgi:Glyoxalase/Bleomycin resistance protein/Dioxygenase superfamily